MLHAEVGDVLDVLFQENRAGRIAREVEHQHTRLRRDGLLQHGAREAELIFGTRLDADRHAAGHQDGRSVAHEAGLVVDHFVAGIGDRAQSDVDGLADAHRHENLRLRIVFRAELARDIAADGLAQAGIAPVRRVVRLATLQGGHGLVAHRLRRVEVRLTHAQRNHVLARGDDVEKLADARKRQRLHVRRHSAFAVHGPASSPWLLLRPGANRRAESYQPPAAKGQSI